MGIPPIDMMPIRQTVLGQGDGPLTGCLFEAVVAVASRLQETGFSGQTLIKTHLSFFDFVFYNRYRCLEDAWELYFVRSTEYGWLDTMS
jgi:hypothetical protein